MSDPTVETTEQATPEVEATKTKAKGAAQFAAVLGDVNVLAAADAVMSGVSSDKKTFDTLVDALMVHDDIWKTRAVVSLGLDFLFIISGVNRKSLTSTSEQNAFDYRKRTIIKMVGERKGWEAKTPTFELDSRVKAFVKSLHKSIDDNQVEASKAIEAYRTALDTLELELTA